jgi:predicted transposase/invertase (TIGR01784 family)
MRPIFANPKTDFVFHRLFGTEEHKDLLVALLNALLELDERHQIVHVDLLSPEQRPQVDELKFSIVDVKCRDAAGTEYVVEMQVLNVEGFEKRVVYNVAKAYSSQLAIGEAYPALNDVIGISICDFELWPKGPGAAPVPMLSRWRMQEQHSGAKGLGQLQLVFLELPKYDTSREPISLVEKWAYFFREATHLRAIPHVLQAEPLSAAMDAARTARFSEDEWDAYIRAGMAIQDGRGALSLARAQGLAQGERRGLEKGREDGLREGVSALCDVLGIALTPSRTDELRSLDHAGLEALIARLRTTRVWSSAAE